MRYENVPIFTTGVLQTSVALSRTEAEYSALSDGGRYSVWLQNVLNERGIPHDCTATHLDTASEIERTKGGPTNHTSKSKQVDIRHSCGMELVKAGTVKLGRTKTSELEVNLLSKELAPSDLELEL